MATSTVPSLPTLRAHDLGVSLQTSYQGDIDHEFLDNATAPQYVNCAVLIIHMPAQAELRELTAVVEGKIFSLSLTPPNRGWQNRTLTCTRCLAYEPTALY
jgi:hypothetical protein